MDELRLYRMVLETSGELVWSLDPAGRWTSLSATGARRLYGREPAELVGRPFIDVVAPDLRERDYALFRRVLEGRPVADHETRHLRSDGSMIDVSITAVALRDAQGRLIGAAGTVRDIRERKRSSVALHESVSQLRLALEVADRGREETGHAPTYRDELTGLPNRRLLDDRLAQALHLAQRRDRKLSVMLVDLDDFRQVNDLLGRPAGDRALREVAQRLAGCVRRADTLARHDGDAFAILLCDVRAESDCSLVAEKALSSLRRELAFDGQTLTLAASIGISLFPADAADGETLLRNADAAMCRAKQRGRNQVEFYGR